MPTPDRRGIPNRAARLSAKSSRKPGHATIASVRDRAGYILVGGKSSRFGSDKALFEIEGRPLALRLAGFVEQAAAPVKLVGPPERYSHLGLPVIPDTLIPEMPISDIPISDAHPAVGPLAGILAALEDSTHSWNLVLACDMPLVAPELLNLLFTRAEQSSDDVWLPVSPAGLDEPLCAVYSKRAAPAIRRQIVAGTRKVTRALDGLAVRRLLPAEYAHIDPAGKSFTNVNTQDDWDVSQP